MQDKKLFFSIELESKASLKNLSLKNGSDNSALVEGTIGNLVNATFAEEEILEIIGEKGTLRINLKPNELKNASLGTVVKEHGATLEKSKVEVEKCKN